ncbi:MAG: glycoside hydrolase family 2, partial [Tunicatimonas sp.]
MLIPNNLQFAPKLAGSLAILFLLTNCQPQETQEAPPEWQPQPVSITTQWTEDVSPKNAHQEYPRPQMVREQWLNLNGLWEYAITDKDGGMPNEYQGEILVPFPIESALSGVKKMVQPDQKLWYRKTFTVPE